MNDHRPDPFEGLAQPIEPQTMRPSFVRSLRTRLAAELGLESEIPHVTLPGRNPMSTESPTTDTPTATTASPTAFVVTPYLTVTGGAQAIEWYRQAFGALEQFRVADDQGRLGHAELDIAGARVMLSDEHPELDVVSPSSLGGTSVALHLEVADVDAIYQQAVAAGATALRPPADQPHGARHGTLLDPFGHRWMLSQSIENVSIDEYTERAASGGYHVEQPRKPDGGVWSAVFYRDAMEGIRFLVDVLGFEERLVVPGPDNSVVHSELVWPGGGVVQVGTYNPDNPYSRTPGSGGLYLITADPYSVWERCQAAGVEVVDEPRNPDYEPDSMVFSVRDPEGNIFSIGSYGG